MLGEFNGLQALILKENEFARYIHCYTHQLQLALVGAVKKVDQIDDFFTLVTNVINVIGFSCKRRDKPCEKQAQRFLMLYREKNFQQERV